MRDFRRLEVWRKAHDLTLAVYEVAADFPGDERYGLTSQIKRAAASVAANLAEGSGRETDKDFCRFVDIASGSACEVEYHLLLAKDLLLLHPDKHLELDGKVNEVKRMLAGLSRRLRAEKSND